MSSFQLISDGDVRLDRRPQQMDPKLTDSDPIDLDASDTSKIFIGEYEIETSQELQYVMGILALAQLKSFGALVERIKSLAASAGWQTQLASAVALEDHLQEIILQWPSGD